ncbi:MAG: 1,2-phenylacetyl-CoA epoxidase subunit B [Bacteroidetes bacterium]|nr:1,2-phenylacetyl-CoA epoxidase subunit B [Bacteroidota bacterium]
MKIQSLDPRITRSEIELEKPFDEAKELDQWQTYEVFHQTKRGQQHQHVGCVHAPNAEMALLFAKEVYGRRGLCVNLWVAKSSNIFATDYEDADIFECEEVKTYRDPGYYKVMDRIKAFKEKQQSI